MRFQKKKTMWNHRCDRKKEVSIMKLSAIQVKFETSKYLALKRYAAKKEVSLEQELEETLNRLYRKLVPPDVREYIEEGERNGKGK
ncbi:MAG: DUF6103 family protein [Enterocloster sp.]